MNRWHFLLPMLLLTICKPAAADPAMECGIQKSSQVEVASCVADVAKLVDQTLQQALGFAQKAAAELDKTTGRNSAQPALETAQASWTAYRDAECSYRAALFGGGSGAGIAEGSCRIALTRTRITDLMASLP